MSNITKRITHKNLFHQHSQSLTDYVLSKKKKEYRSPSGGEKADDRLK